MNKCKRSRARHSQSVRVLLAVTTLAASALNPAARADQTKQDNLLSLNDPASWLTALPTSSDVAIFDNTLQGSSGYNFSLDADQSWAGIRVLDPHSAITFAAGNTLTLGNAGIDMSAATHSLTLNNSLLLGASQTWNTISALTSTDALNLAANSLFINGLGSTTITGPISGTGSITKNNSGTLTLAGTNNFSGSFTQLAGLTVLTSNSALGANTGSLVLGGGTLSLASAGTMTLAKSVNITGDSTIDITSTLAQFSKSFSGAGTIHWILNGHTLDLGVFSVIPSFASFSGTLDFTNSNGTIHLLGNSSAATTDLHFDNTTINLGTGSAKLTVTNPSTQTLGALSGGINTTLAQGGTGNTTFIIGNLNTASTFAGSLLNGTANGATLSLTKSGAGTLTLSGTASNYTGPVTIQSGLLSISTLAGLGAATSSSGATNLLISSPSTPATLQYTGPADTTSRAFTINSAATIDASGTGPLTFASTAPIVYGGSANRTLTLAGSNTGLNTFSPLLKDITGAKTSLIKSGPGTWVLTGQSNNYSGGTSINQGTLLVNSVAGTTTGTGNINVLGGTYGGIGNNITMGSVTLSAGAHLSPGIPGTSSGVGLLNFNNLNLNANSVLDLDFSATGTNDILNLFSTTLTLTDAINVNVYQAGTALPFAATGSYSIFTGIGTLAGDAANDLHVINGATNAQYTFSHVGSSIFLTIAGTPDAAWLGATSSDWSDATNWLGGNIPGSSAGQLAAFGPAAARFTVALNAPRRLGTITFDSGTNSGYTLAPGTGGKLFLDNGTASASIAIASGTHTIAANVELSTGATITFSNPATLTLSGTLNSGTSNSATGLAITGPGKALLTANNTFGGATTIGAASTLQLGDGHSAGTFGTGPVNNAGTLIVNRSDSASLPNPISGTGSFTQAGTGTTTLTGATSYSGPTTISAGKLIFAGVGPHTVATITGPGALEAAAPLTSDGVTTALWQIDSGITHTIRPNGSASGTSLITSLLIAGTPGAWTGKLDLTNNALIIPTSAGTLSKAAVLSMLQDQVSEARNNGPWNGPGGITSSTVAASATNSQQTLGLAIADNAKLGLSSFRGQGGLDNTTLIVTQAHLGDADLNGLVDIQDLNTVTSHWQKSSGALWSDGDFTSSTGVPDGKVDIQDLNAVTSFWQFGVGSPFQPAAAPLAPAPSFAVPEPASLAILAAGATLLRKPRKPRAGSL